MERILTVKQMKDADAFTINNLGVAQEELVECAGKALAVEIINRYKGGRVLVCIGKGNNGKDGEVASRILSRTHGFSVVNFYVGDDLSVFDKKFDIIVDCIFGVGLNREVESEYKTIIEKINDANSVVVSCDIPSGLDGDSGKPLGVAVEADLTVAIQEYKLGHFINDGLDYCGKVISKDIGISIWGDDFIYRIKTDSMKKYFQKRMRNTNKGTFGKVSIIGGSAKYSGSAILSMNALTALKTGVGYSTLLVPKSLYDNLIGLNPECILTALPEIEGFIKFDEKALSHTLGDKTVALGMGMGVSEQVYKIIEYYLQNYCGTLLIDADGLNSLSAFGVEILKNKKCRVVLTPHITEFSRLIKKDKAEIINNGVALAKEFALNYGVTVVLKNATSIITDGKIVYLNTAGCSALAKAGSGDVLSGIAAGILSRAEDVAEGAATACYILGKSAEIASEKSNDYAVTATDVIKEIGSAINSLV